MFQQINIKIQSLCPISYKGRIFQQVQGNLGVLRLVIDFTINEHIICFIILFLLVEWYRGPIDMDAKALVNHEPIDLNMETLGFQNKNKNQVLACVLTWMLDEEES